MSENGTATGDTVTFFDRTYDEALQLARDARDYIAAKGQGERAGMSPDLRLAASCEEMRITARITQVMAWMLVQRAVHAGEMTRAEAAEEPNRLSGQSACLGEPVVPEAELPPRLSSLLQRSRSLYERVQRLDATLDG